MCFVNDVNRLIFFGENLHVSASIYISVRLSVSVVAPNAMVSARM